MKMERMPSRQHDSGRVTDYSHITGLWKCCRPTAHDLGAGSQNPVVRSCPVMGVVSMGRRNTQVEPDLH